MVQSEIRVVVYGANCTFEKFRVQSVIKSILLGGKV